MVKNFSIFFSSMFFQGIFISGFKKSSKFLSLILICIFFFLLWINVSSIFPYTFPFTTQISFVFFFSLNFWFRFLLFSFIYNLKRLISHKIPEGSPISLSIFLFLIEIVREIIRPLTLSLRLVGNIVVGHVLLSLFFNLLCFFNWLFPFFLMLNTVEILVCFIQSYIFFTLICIYSRE